MSQKKAYNGKKEAELNDALSVIFHALAKKRRRKELYKALGRNADYILYLDRSKNVDLRYSNIGNVSAFEHLHVRHVLENESYRRLRDIFAQDGIRLRVSGAFKAHAGFGGSIFLKLSRPHLPGQKP